MEKLFPQNKFNSIQPRVENFKLQFELQKFTQTGLKASAAILLFVKLQLANFRNIWF